MLNYIGDKVAVVGQPFALNLLASESRPGQPDIRSRAGFRPPRRSRRERFTDPPRSTGRRPRPTRGAYQVTFTVTDTGNGTTTQPSSTSTTIRLVVRSSDTAPIFPAHRTSATVAEGQALSLAGHRQQARRRPAHIHRHEPALRCQPQPRDGTAHLDAAAGPGRATIRCRSPPSDGSMSSTETVNITVTHTDFTPVFVPLLPQYGREGTQVQFTVVAGDLDGDSAAVQSAERACGCSVQCVEWTVHLDARVRPGGRLTRCTSRPPTRRVRRATHDVVFRFAHVVRPPVLNTPNHQATLGMPLAFQIQATDLDAGTTLSLLGRQPAGRAPRSMPRRGCSSGRPGRRRRAITSSRCKFLTGRRRRRRTFSSTRPCSHSCRA